jgi:hypothetical protein
MNTKTDQFRYLKRSSKECRVSKRAKISVLARLWRMLQIVSATLILGFNIPAGARDVPLLRALPTPLNDLLYWTLLDANNQVIVAPGTLLQLGDFVDLGEGRLRANAQAADGKWGYLDEHGQWVVEPKLDEARSFVAGVGLARARQGMLWGYVQADGTWRVKPSYESARPFIHGFALVAKHKKSDYFFIDSKGKKAFEGVFSNAHDFGHNAMAPVAQGKRWGYIDQTGKIVIQPQFYRAFPFNVHGVAQVKAKPTFSLGLLGELLGSTTSDADEARYGVIDTKGNWVIKPKFEYLWNYNDDGLAWGQWQENGDDIEGYVDTQGELVWKTNYLNFHDLMNGLMCHHRDHYQFYSPRGQVVIAEHSKWADSFRDAQVTIALRDTWGLLYRDGRFKSLGSEFLEPLVNSEQSVIGFREGLLAGITQDRNIAYYDRDGERQFTLLPGKDGLLTLNDTKGKTLWGGAQAAVRVHAELTPGPEDHFADPKDWSGGIVMLAKQLIASPPRAFYPQYTYGDKVDFYHFEISDVYNTYDTLNQLPHGAYKLLAYSYLDEGFLGYYNYLWEEYPMFGKVYFPALRKQLVAHFGKPFEEGGYENLLLWGDFVERAIWRLGERYLMLQSAGQIGDGDLEQALMLAVVDASFIEGNNTDESKMIPVPPHSETPFIAETSDPRVKELVRQAAQAVHPAPRDARRMIAEALALVGQGAQISEYDYLWTQYGLLKSSHDTNTSNFAHGTLEEYLDTAQRVLAYLDEHGQSAGVFMPGIAEENEFKGEVYREAANALAWLIHEDDKSTPAELETALIWAKKAEKHIRGEEDYYILDTKVRILLRLGNREDAYQIVDKVLREDPEFSDFQDFINNDDFLSWRHADFTHEYETPH